MFSFSNISTTIPHLSSFDSNSLSICFCFTCYWPVAVFKMLVWNDDFISVLIYFQVRFQGVWLDSGTDGTHLPGRRSIQRPNAEMSTLERSNGTSWTSSPLIRRRIPNKENSSHENGSVAETKAENRLIKIHREGDDPGLTACNVGFRRLSGLCADETTLRIIPEKTEEGRRLWRFLHPRPALDLHALNTCAAEIKK